MIIMRYEMVTKDGLKEVKELLKTYNKDDIFDEDDITKIALQIVRTVVEDLEQQDDQYDKMAEAASEYLPSFINSSN